MDPIYASVFLVDPVTMSSNVTQELATLAVDTPTMRLTLRAPDPGVLRDLGHALIDLADDLEVAQRPYVGDEDAERGAES